jgi:hypothetical protein
MILYVNGDSHTAAAEAVNHHAFAEDDSALWPSGREPHPDNLAVSWGKQLADLLSYTLVCNAESASSNDRIIRTTRQYLESGANPDLIVIQWSTWEREEWVFNRKWYQVNASGIDRVPKGLIKDYKHYIANIDWTKKTQQTHEKIWDFHLYLCECKLRHVFFNGNNNFADISARMDWQDCYIDPYTGSFDQVLKELFEKRNNGYHYGADAHKYWAGYLKIYLDTKKITNR